MSAKKEFYSRRDKPEVIPPDFGGIPDALAKEPRWMLWRLEWNGKKWTKVPKQTNGRNGSSTDPGAWTTFDAVRVAFGKKGFDGIGFALGDGYVGIDLDDARNAQSETVEPWASEILGAFKSYAEVSPSGTGLKIITRGTWPETAGHKRECESGEIEVYGPGRYFALTGKPLAGTEVFEEQATLDDLSLRFSPAPAAKTSPARSPIPMKAEDTDTELIERAMKAKNGPKFKRLWNGDTSDVGRDDSRADLALCGLLAFYTGPDEDRIDALFRQSGLMRDKWDSKRGASTYGRDTIAKALEGKTEFYTPRGTGVGPKPNSKLNPESRSGTSSPVRVPEYRPFPVDALPPVLREFVSGVAKSIGCDPSYAALPALALAGASIGGSLAAMPKKGWKEVPILWALVVGDSGTAKSPAASVVREIADGIEDELEAKYEREEAEYLRQVEAIRNGSDGPEGGSCAITGVEPKRPVREYFEIDDVTIERLVVDLKHSPRGLFLIQDEMANWFSSFGRYKGKNGGSDSAKWLSMFAGESVSYKRRTGEPKEVRVRRAIVSISGGIQPGILKTAFTDSSYYESGLSARLVFAMPPKQIVRWNEEVLDAGAESRYREAIRFLRALTCDPKHPAFVGFEAEAKREFVRYHDENAEKAEGIDGGPMASAIPKISRISLRCALIHHAMTCAAEGIDPGRESISLASVRAGITLARWFMDEAERVYAMLAESPEDRESRNLAELIQRKGGTITARELSRSNARRYQTAVSAEAALDALVDSGRGEWREEVAPNGKTVRKVHIVPDVRRCPTLYSDEPLATPRQPPDTIRKNKTESLEKPVVPFATSDNVGRRAVVETPKANTDVPKFRNRATSDSRSKSVQQNLFENEPGFPD